jgi:DNA-binding NarL/FixJ family response regulator
MIRTAIADDQALVRGGFRMILEAQSDMEVVGEASNGAEALHLIIERRPDVVLMDIQMPTVDGLEATRRVASNPSLARTRIVMLTTFGSDEYVYQALKSGASGFLLKDAPPETLADAVRTVAAGDSLLAPTILRRLIDDFVRRPSPAIGTPLALHELTQREREVLRLIAKGHTNAEIAAELFLSEATVKTHVGRIFSKLDLRDRVQAVILGYRLGLVSPSDQP